MKTVKNNKNGLIVFAVMFLIALVDSIINKEYTILIWVSAFGIYVVLSYINSKIMYDETGITIRIFTGRTFFVDWNDVVYIGESWCWGKHGKYSVLKITYKYSGKLKERQQSLTYNFHADGVQELLEYYQNILREMQRDYD